MGVWDRLWQGRHRRDAMAAEQLTMVRHSLYGIRQRYQEGRYLLVVTGAERRARRGTRAYTQLDDGYRIDAWFDGATVVNGQILVVRGSVGAGTQRSAECLYVDTIESTLPSDIYKRADRHWKRERRRT